MDSFIEIREKDIQMKRAVKVIIILLAAAIVILGVGLFFFPPTSFIGGINGDGNDSPDIGQTQQEPETPVNITISCVGDVMAHSTQIKAQYVASDGSYSFDNNFEYVSSYISSADLALCNVETTFAGSNYSGYPLFCAPDQLAQALKNAGFDIAITANNHMMDKGLSGLERTIQVLRATGMQTVGSQYDGEAPYAIADVKGVKVGVVAYTYETTGSAGGGMTINGNPVPTEAQSHINSFNYHDLENDMAVIAANINTLRQKGAEIVVCYMHWGEEYQRQPNSYQTDLAQRLADMGADVIFASHPHVLQGVGTVKSALSGRDVPVFYSMGNFISNQRAETLNNRYTEQGMIAFVGIEYMKSTGQILSTGMSVLPTWVDRSSSGTRTYRIIPLDANLDSNPGLAETGHLARAQQALQDVNALIGAEYIYG